ncbi:hypothetical protein WH96_14045 [Kiloniella spongiae]|uniref:Flagellar protein FliT n=1 Tax=Kiloniella spongiae TaxID=1489064 RepID=A0A0H2MU92_9PROT|nr:hypothetical protein [Kiloniella spongiae]KLN60290.1 hypothetical protein WH96_14045 [Kiloniella spongiae]
MTKFEELQEQIIHLSQQIALANSTIKSGGDFDMTDLPKVTDFLCQELQNLPAAERAKLSSKLLALIEELDNLTITINSNLDKVRVEIKETTSHNKAARAYTSANISGKK